MKKPCTLLLNTRWGYVMSPIHCESIAEALRKAEESEMAYRIFCDGKLKKHGWFK